jgi:hypothetical protein
LPGYLMVNFVRFFFKTEGQTNCKIIKVCIALVSESWRPALRTSRTLRHTHAHIYIASRTLRHTHTYIYIYIYINLSSPDLVCAQDVKFPFLLDAFELCSPELQARLNPQRTVSDATCACDVAAAASLGALAVPVGTYG